MSLPQGSEMLRSSSHEVRSWFSQSRCWQNFVKRSSTSPHLVRSISGTWDPRYLIAPNTPLASWWPRFRLTLVLEVEVVTRIRYQEYWYNVSVDPSIISRVSHKSDVPEHLRNPIIASPYRVDISTTPTMNQDSSWTHWVKHTAKCPMFFCHLKIERKLGVSKLSKSVLRTFSDLNKVTIWDPGPP